MSRFIAPYMNYFLKSTDAPVEFGEASALMTLSGISLGRKWLNYDDGIKANLFMMIVGDSSVARKSTSVKRSRKIFTAIEPSKVGPSDYTIEGLIRWMKDKDPTTNKSRNKVVIFAEEFGADLSRAASYKTSFGADLCAMYDGERIEKVRAGQSLIIEKPRVSLFAAAAYQMLQSYLGRNDWTNGFLMRFLFVAPYNMRPGFSLPPAPPKQEQDMATAALHSLKYDLAQNPGGLNLDAQATTLYEDYTRFLKAEAAQGDFVMRTYVERFSINLLKIALLFQIDIDPNAPVNHRAMWLAVEFANRALWPGFRKAFAKTGLHFESLVSGIVATLRRNGEVTVNDLVDAYGNHPRLADAVSLCVQNRVAEKVSFSINKIVEPGLRLNPNYKHNE